MADLRKIINVTLINNAKDLKKYVNQVLFNKRYVVKNLLLFMRLHMSFNNSDLSKLLMYEFH